MAPADPRPPGPDSLHPPADHPQARLTLHVDGEPVPALPGQTVAGALIAAGRIAWRTTRHGRPRGVFCGIGVCSDCLVEVNGLRDVRACQRRVRDGDVVRTQDTPLSGPGTEPGAADPGAPR